MEDKPTPIKFFTDAHIAKAVAVQLREKGVDIVRCQEVGLADVDDPDLIAYAAQEGRTIVTHDRGFSGHHRDWLEAERTHFGILIVDSDFQGFIGVVVNKLLEFHELVEGGAATIEEDFANQVLYA